MTEIDHPRALAALCDADRFFYVSRSTYARELAEALAERRRAARVVLGSAANALTGGANADDGVVAQQELREGIDMMNTAARLLREDAATRAALVDALRGDQVGRPFEGRVDALQAAVRAAHEALRGEIPGAPALPTWGADDEDREIARAAGAGIRPGHIIAATLMAAYFIYFMVLT